MNVIYILYKNLLANHKRHGLNLLKITSNFKLTDEFIEFLIKFILLKKCCTFSKILQSLTAKY